MNNVPLIIIAVTAFASVVLAGFAVYTYLRGERARSWPTAPGNVTQSSVRRSTSTSSDGSSSDSYSPGVEFTYSVNGASHSSDRITVGLYRVYSHASATAVAARYPVNAKVTVHYDPQDPSYGVLESGAPRMTLLALGVGSLFTASIACFTYFNTLRIPS